MKVVRTGLCRSLCGFTLIEMLTSVGIMMVVFAALFALMNPTQGIFQAQTEHADMQARLRIAVQMMSHDLINAGAGPYAGSGREPLANYFATVLPFRHGPEAADPPGSFKSDVVSLMYVPSPSLHLTTSVVMADVTADIPIDHQTGCPLGRSLCGFEVGSMAVIFDDTGIFDIFRITGTAVAPAAAVEHLGQPLVKAYGRGASVAPIVAVTYWLKPDGAANVSQLMRSAGESAFPLVDNVVAVRFEYFGDPQPPRLRKPVTDPKGPWTTYGPKPPPVEIDDPSDIWGAGENCLFTVVDRQHVTRAELTLYGASDGLVKIEPGRLTDGPWCPDAAARFRSDADLLRVRKVRVTLRVQAGLEALRGRGVLFARPGTSQGGERYLPDQEIKFDVAPRNLSFSR